MPTPVSESGPVTAAGPAQFPLVLGLDTFGDVTHDAEDRPLSPAQTIRNVVEQGVLADQVGVVRNGGLSHEALMTSIELYGTQVIPRVRELLAS